MADLTLTEQKHVRTMLHHLRRRVGAWQPLADALHVSRDTVEKCARGKNTVTVNLAFRVSRFAGVALDDLLAGRSLPGACPRCGYAPDFGDEETIVETTPCAPLADAPAPPQRGLKLIP